MTWKRHMAAVIDMKKTYGSCHWWCINATEGALTEMTPHLMESTCQSNNSSQETCLMRRTLWKYIYKVEPHRNTFHCLNCIYHTFLGKKTHFFLGFPARMEPRLLGILGEASVCEIGKLGLIYPILVNSHSLGWHLMEATYLANNNSWETYLMGRTTWKYIYKAEPPGITFDWFNCLDQTISG